MQLSYRQRERIQQNCQHNYIVYSIYCLQYLLSTVFIVYSIYCLQYLLSTVFIVYSIYCLQYLLSTVFISATICEHEVHLRGKTL